jgi:dCMP deaminase
MNKIVAAYIPVLHDGYRQLLEKHQDADIFYVFGDEVTALFDYLKKDIRALDPALIVKSIEAWGLAPAVKLLDAAKLGELKALKKNIVTIVMPDEDICRELAESYFQNQKVIFEPIFLRWDRHNSVAENPIAADVVISRKAFDRKMIREAGAEAGDSSDFWRHVGAALVKDGKVISIVHNTHVPSAHMPYAHSDPRNAFKKGLNIEISTSIHAEARLIAEAAHNGRSLKGTSMYVTVFPCPACAKLIAYSGIAELYFGSGYGVLDGESILKSRGVKIIYVEPGPKEKPEQGEWKGYSKK